MGGDVCLGNITSPPVSPPQKVHRIATSGDGGNGEDVF